MSLRLSGLPTAFFLSIVFYCSGVFAADAESSETVTVAVASNFMAPMKAIAEKFEQATGHQVNLAFGSSGKLYAQIRNGAPFQLFLSADQIKPNELAAASLVVEGSQYTYAQGKLALLSAGHVDEAISSREVQSLLGNGSFNKLAIANPRVAPYGQAAIEVLDAMGIYQQVSEKIVRGENISQTYQFVSTGNADLGFVALSQISSLLSVSNAANMANAHSVVNAHIAAQVVHPNKYWLVPENLYSPIRQDMVLLQTKDTNAAASALYEWIKSEEIQMLIQSYGYGVDTLERAEKS